MSQPSYLQQIAQRNSGRFSELMPPRSPFQNWETPVPLEISDESPPVSAQIERSPVLPDPHWETPVPLEISDESPSVSAQIERSPVLPDPPALRTTSLAKPPIQPQNVTDLPTTSQAERSPDIPPATTIPTASLANPPIQLEGKTLEPSATSVSPTEPVVPNPERVRLETSASKETTEPRNSSSLRSESLTAIAPRALQRPERGLPEQKPDVTENTSPPERGLPKQKPDVTENTSPPAQRTIAAVPSKNSLIEGRDRAQSPTKNRPPTESPLVRWLTPTVQDIAVEKPSPETSEREISSEAKGLPVPLVAREQSPQGNTVRIGTIDIQILPPPVVPQPAPSSSLSRGFASSFGLRQG